MEALIVEMIEKGIRLPLAQKDFERKFLRLALDIHLGNRIETAKTLGIHRNTLGNKLSKHRLS
jgi:DNA-binding NtrC family response regulator